MGRIVIDFGSEIFVKGIRSRGGDYLVFLCEVCYVLIEDGWRGYYGGIRRKEGLMWCVYRVI